MKFFIYSFLILSALQMSAQEGSVLTIDFEGIKTSEGKLFVALYESEDAFLKEPLIGKIVTVTNGKATVVFEDLDTGVYAVSSFYDTNNNGKMDTNFLGIPKEPTAMSNQAKGSFGPPKFKDAKFEITSTSKTIQIKF
tara:strand:- start:57801 stop:58214 length:414 start_codon:yes stop_codon:yes gene_type:complete